MILKQVITRAKHSSTMMKRGVVFWFALQIITFYRLALVVLCMVWGLPLMYAHREPQSYAVVHLLLLCSTHC